MERDNERLNGLFARFVSGEAGDLEREEFFGYVQDPAFRLQLEELVSSLYEDASGVERMDPLRRELVFENIIGAGVSAAPKKLKLWPLLRVVGIAAVLAVVCSAVFYFYFRERAVVPAANVYANDIAPGANRAVLVLSNGKRIELSGAVKGELAEQTGVRISRDSAGMLVYTVTGRGEASGKEFNTVQTPRGGQGLVRLPDGTRVWMNASSVLRYPVGLASLGERRVFLSGEAYLEVAKDRSRPFRVETGGQVVEVLGTHFNVEGYGDDRQVRTVLLEGSVRVSAGGADRVLRPGEQSVSGGGEGIAVSAADVEDAVAWKNGEFVFERQDIKTVMKRLARWYDIEVEYLNDVGTATFSGSVSRYGNISKILDKIAFTGAAHFKVEGRRVTVSR